MSLQFALTSYSSNTQEMRLSCGELSSWGRDSHPRPITSNLRPCVNNLIISRRSALLKMISYPPSFSLPLSLSLFLSLASRSLEDQSLTKHFCPFHSILRLSSMNPNSFRSSITFLNHIFLELPLHLLPRGYPLYNLSDNVLSPLRSTLMT